MKRSSKRRREDDAEPHDSPPPKRQSGSHAKKPSKTRRAAPETDALVPRVSSGTATDRGMRPSMEDTHVEIADVRGSGWPTCPATAFWAVYDGHGGDDVAVRVAETLHRELFEALSRAEGGGGDEEARSDVCGLISDVFRAVDGPLLKACREKDWLCGTTAVCATLVGGTLYIANVGDSELVTCTMHEGRPIAHVATEKHVPMNDREASRVRKAGGNITEGAIVFTLGRRTLSLAVSRALGDATFKRPFAHPKYTDDLVLADPTVTVCHLTPSEPFFIMGSDGLWDTITYKKAVRECARLKEQGKTPKEVARHLADLAIENGSEDNVTCTVVYLDWDQSDSS
eukprot:m51a1_g2309 putative protein phosphatase (342) ;mRNA; f:463094-464387